MITKNQHPMTRIDSQDTPQGYPLWDEYACTVLDCDEQHRFWHGVPPDDVRVLAGHVEILRRGDSSARHCYSCAPDGLAFDAHARILPESPEPPRREPPPSDNPTGPSCSTGLG